MSSSITVTGKKISAEYNQAFGENQPAAIYIQGVHHIHGVMEKLEFVVFDGNGSAIMSGNETIAGDDYSAWDKNNAEYPYEYVCAKRGFSIVD